jgi:hypothetical protein
MLQYMPRGKLIHCTKQRLTRQSQQSARTAAAALDFLPQDSYCKPSLPCRCSAA